MFEAGCQILSRNMIRCSTKLEENMIEQGARRASLHRVMHLAARSRATIKL